MNSLVFLLIASLLSVSCSTTSKIEPTKLLVTEADFEKDQESYSIDLAKSDMQVLLHFFENGYSGYGFIDHELVKNTVRELEALPSSGTSTWGELCSNISSIFQKLPDGHLQAHNEGNNCLEHTKSNLKQKAGVGVNIAEQHTTEPFYFTFRTIKKRKVGILGIKYFPSFDDKRWRKFEEAIEKLKQSSSIVIDLRGNSGGDDTRGIQLASKLAGRTILKGGYAIDFEGTNPATYVLILNKIRSKERKSSKEAWKRYREIYENKLKHPPKGQYTSTFSEELAGIEVTGSPFTKPIYVLSDRECGSSGESTLHALRQLKNVTVVGQNTAGTTHFGNQGLLILPHSRLRISMSTKFIKFKNGSFVEKIGHAPDIYLEDGKDALDFVLNNKM